MTKAHNTQILEMDPVTLIMMLIHLSCPQNDLSADPQQYFLNTATNSRSDLSILLLITIHFPPIELKQWPPGSHPPSTRASSTSSVLPQKCFSLCPRTPDEWFFSFVHTASQVGLPCSPNLTLIAHHTTFHSNHNDVKILYLSIYFNYLPPSFKM